MGWKTLAAALAVSLLTTCAGPPEPRDTGLLVFWKVENEAEPDARVWLLGTVHLARPDLALDPQIANAFQASRALVVEVDTRPRHQARIQALVREYGVLPDGTTAEEVLPDDTWELLEHFLRKRNLPPEAYEWYEPWMLLTLVTSAVFAEAGADAGEGVETRLLSQVGDKPVISLETPEFQLDLLRSTPRPLVASMLHAVLTSADATRDAEKLLDAWDAGDLDAIEEIALVETEDDPDLAEFLERTFYERNRNMARHLAKILEGPGTFFVAVGAGHMTGDQGIPALLEAQGFRVERVARRPAGD